MTVARKRERPEGAPTPTGPNIRVIHSIGTTDMTSVAQTKREPRVPDDIAHDINKLAILARQGDALCQCLMLEEVRDTLDSDQMHMAIWDLSDKFDRLADKLERIWSQ